MNSHPETRISLLIRVRDPADQAAWNEFVEIYQPVILRLARQKGMQEADAEDVAQSVLSAIAKAIEQREHDPKRAKFRTWLHRVTHNTILNALTRGKPDRGSGDSALLAVLDQQESHAGPDSDLLQLEHRRVLDRE
jgi:RNA polymerase sigma factor (sigma-70 family)